MTSLFSSLFCFPGGYFVLSLVVRACPPPAVAGWRVTGGCMSGGIVFVYVPHVLLSLFSRPQAGLVAVVDSHSVLKVIRVAGHMASRY